MSDIFLCKINSFVELLGNVAQKEVETETMW